MSTLSLTVLPEIDGAVVISPRGEIDADNAHEIKDAVSGLLATSRPLSIRIDMVDVSFIDSVGIGALVACYHAAAASNIRLLVTNPTAYVHRVLYVSGLLGLFGSPARPPEQHVSHLQHLPHTQPGPQVTSLTHEPLGSEPIR